MLRILSMNFSWVLNFVFWIFYIFFLDVLRFFLIIYFFKLGYFLFLFVMCVVRKYKKFFGKKLFVLKKLKVFDL